MRVEGPYHAGLCTVSAVYGRDTSEPTALFKSVSRISSKNGSNTKLLKMKFVPMQFERGEDRAKFSDMLRTIIRLSIGHALFNVVNRDQLLAAINHPEANSNLVVRVAGCIAYFTELARDLPEEIIARTEYSLV